jgi:hypothetical protein
MKPGHSEQTAQHIDHHQLRKVIDFLAVIGIPCTVSDQYFAAFLPGIRIVQGELEVNPRSLLCVGDILHEAGHLACLPAALRAQADDNIEDTFGPHQAMESGAILWSVAAAHHLDIPLTAIFHPAGYKGEADWLLDQYSSGNYLGLPLLQWMGLAATEKEQEEEGLPSFPHMLRWLRDE